MKRLGQYLKTFPHAAQHGAQFARAVTLIVDGVVDEIDQQVTSDNRTSH